MIQLSLDGRRLYVTNSLYSTWDNQFYPGLRSWLTRINCSPEGGMEIDPHFFIDFHDRRDGPAQGPPGPPPGRRLHHRDLPMISAPFSRTSAASPSKRPSGPSDLPFSWGLGSHGRSFAPASTRSAPAPAAHAPATGGVQCGPANLNSNTDDESVASPQGRHTPAALRPGGPAQNQPPRATPLLLAANASISTCAEFTPVSDEPQSSRRTLHVTPVLSLSMRASGGRGTSRLDLVQREASQLRGPGCPFAHGSRCARLRIVLSVMGAEVNRGRAGGEWVRGSGLAPVARGCPALSRCSRPGRGAATRSLMG